MGLGAAHSGACGSPPSRGRLAAEGCTRTGATMSIVAHRTASVSGSGSGSGCCCRCCGGHHHRHYCVNIYVNSNVQGVTNSVLVGSKVVMRDPGPRVSSRQHQPQRDVRRREGKRSSRQQCLQDMAKTIKVIGIVAVVSLLFVSAAAIILCLHLFVRVRQ